MKNHQYAYHFEASTEEPSYYGANRTRLLLEKIKPEIEMLGKRPIYYHFILLTSPDSQFMIDDFEGLSNFMEAKDDVEKYWNINETDGEPNTITMHLIAIFD